MTPYTRSHYVFTKKRNKSRRRERVTHPHNHRTYKLYSLSRAVKGRINLNKKESVKSVLYTHIYTCKSRGECPLSLLLSVKKKKIKEPTAECVSLWAKAYLLIFLLAVKIALGLSLFLSLSACAGQRERERETGSTTDEFRGPRDFLLRARAREDLRESRDLNGGERERRDERLYIKSAVRRRVSCNAMRVMKRILYCFIKLILCISCGFSFRNASASGIYYAACIYGRNLEKN